MASNNVVITDNVRSALTDFLAGKKYSKIAVLVDENTHQHCFPIIKDLFQDPLIIEIPSGEEHKNLSTCEKIWGALTDAKFDRSALMINLGGGVIGDMGGFCAATYKRGIDFIQVPTTLLSQVDASVGGKLGIDFNHFKNHIGIFRIPEVVIIDIVFLQTLSKAELRSGFAEVIKHCLIADDRKWVEIKAKSLEDQDFKDLVAHSVKIKSDITESDPQEKGLRKVLNFGHTLGHAIETFYLNDKNKRLLHGEAVAIGMVAAAYLSKGLLEEEVAEIKKYILSVFEKRPIPEEDFDAILEHTLQDKKNVDNQILATLLDHVGQASFNHPVSTKQLRLALKYYNA